MHHARAAVAYSAVLIMSLAVSACGGGGSHQHADERARAACQDYFSVNGMTGDEARAAYGAGSRLAAAAASADRSWRPLATAFDDMTAFNDDIKAAGQIPPAEEQQGLQATRAVANMCAEVLKRHS